MYIFTLGTRLSETQTGSEGEVKPKGWLVLFVCLRIRQYCVEDADFKARSWCCCFQKVVFFLLVSLASLFKGSRPPHPHMKRKKEATLQRCNMHLHNSPIWMMHFSHAAPNCIDMHFMYMSRLLRNELSRAERQRHAGVDTAAGRLTDGVIISS